MFLFTQGYAYQECLEKYSSSHTFIGFIDLDEFIVINDTKVRQMEC